MTVELEYLLKLDDLKDLDDTALVDVSAQASLNNYQPNDRLVAEKLADHTLYLLSGELDIQSQGGVHQALAASAERAQQPIFSSATPGLYARCTAPCRVLHIDKAVIKKYGIYHNREKDDLNIEEFDTLPAVDSSLALINEILTLFNSRSVKLPSLPEIVLHISLVTEKHPEIEEKKLARLIQMDPVLTARVVQVANSAADEGEPAACASIQQALARIGPEGVRTIIKGVILRDLFTPTSALVRQCMLGFYEHSIRTAVVCYDLAKRLSGFDPNRALLAGLLHDIGAVPILVVADQHAELAHKASNLALVQRQLKSYIGNIMLTQWGFAEEYAVIARHAYDWKRQVDRPDYCDLVQVALMHGHLLGGDKLPGPELNALPAFLRLGLDKVDPQERMQSLQKLGQRVREMMSVLCK